MLSAQMNRSVKPELLDDLPPGDPQAISSRADLRRLNRIMGHAGILMKELRVYLDADSFPRSQPMRICELGAGDGTLLFELARRGAAMGIEAEVTTIDQLNVVSEETRRALDALHWPVNPVTSDIFCWLEGLDFSVDVVLANLFLHHFPNAGLRKLLQMVAGKTRLFVACEPRRSRLALTGSRLVGVIGCNAVTRHDAVASVRAGFAGKELSALWPATACWQLRERSAGLFSHCFVAKRNA